MTGNFPTWLKWSIYCCLSLLITAAVCIAVVAFTDEAPEDDAELQLPEVTGIPDDENLYVAITSIALPAEAWEKDKMYDNDLMEALDKSVVEQPDLFFPLTDEFLRVHQSALEQSMAAAKLQQSQHPLYRILHANDALTTYKRLYKVINIAALQQYHLANAEKTFRYANAIIQISTIETRNAPGIIHISVSSACAKIGYKLSNRALKICTDRKLIQRQILFLATPFPAEEGLQHAIRANYWTAMDLMASLQADLSQTDFSNKLLFKPIRTRNYFIRNAQYQLRLVQGSQESWPSMDTNTEMLAGNSVGHLLFGTLWPVNFYIYRCQSSEALRQLSYVAATVRLYELEHGQLPPSLAALDQAKLEQAKIDLSEIDYSAKDRWLGAEPEEPHTGNTGFAVGYSKIGK